jgi:hypothetical protein
VQFGSLGAWSSRKNDLLLSELKDGSEHMVTWRLVSSRKNVLLLSEL